VLSPFTEIAAKNTPPVLQFEQNGPAIQGEGVQFTPFAGW